MSSFCKSSLHPDAATSLAQMDFSDLMLCADGQSFLRHVVGVRGPIIDVPRDCLAEVAHIRSLIMSEERGKEFFLTHNGIPYRVAHIDTAEGEGYFLRRSAYPVPALDTLGLPSAMAAALRSIGVQSGMILIAGTTGAGKTTTLYSLLSELVAQHGDIAVSVEDPPEVPVQRVHGARRQGLWYQVDAYAAGGYEQAMVAAMRYNPRYIMLGEVRAPAVAHEAIRAAVNGHLVLTTIHAGSLTGGILALQQIAAIGAGSLDLARSILADGLAAVMFQQLLPDPQVPGGRKLHVEMLCFGQNLGLRAKVRSGKLEQLSTEIEAQHLRIMRAELPLEAMSMPAVQRVGMPEMLHKTADSMNSDRLSNLKKLKLL